MNSQVKKELFVNEYKLLLKFLLTLVVLIIYKSEDVEDFPQEQV